MVVFFLCGLWHGASLTFVVWGLYHGLSFLRYCERTRFGTMQEKLPGLFRHLYAILVVMMGWVIFRADTFAAAGNYFHALFLPGRLMAAQPLARYSPTDDALWAIAFGILFSGPLWNWIKTSYAKLEQALPASDRPVVQVPWSIFEIVVIVILLFACSAWLAGGTYNPFIYFRF